MYDRSLFVNAARGVGDRTPSDTHRRLGVARATAWRLWHGRTIPSGRTASLVERHYGVPASQLVKPTAEEVPA